MDEQRRRQAMEKLKADFSGKAAPAPQESPDALSPERRAAAEEKLRADIADMKRPKKLSEAVAREAQGDSDAWVDPGLEIMANAMFFDWLDEAAQAVIAGGATLLTDDPRSAGEIMLAMEESRQRREAEYTEANPGKALAAKLGGAVLSPVNLVGGPAAVTSRLATMGGLAGTAARTGAVATRGAAEGALFAAGEAEVGEGLESAGDGAIGGAGGAVVGKAVLGGLGAVGGKLFSRNIKADLVDADGNFTPMNMIEPDPNSFSENAIVSFYKDVVAPSFLGKTSMKAQQQPIIDKHTKIADESAKALKASLAREKEATEALNDFVKASEAKLKKADNALSQTGEFQNVSKTIASRLESRLESRRVLFRTQAMDESLPAGVNPTEKQKLFSMPVREQNDFLNELWNKHGFKVIKQQDYNLDLDKLTGRMSRILQDDVGIPSVTAKGALGEKGAADFADEFRNLLSGRLQSGGYITGEDAAKVRSLIGTRRSSAFQGDNPDAYRAYTEMQNEFDNLLKSQLPKSAHKAWDADKAAYKTRLTFENASSKANNSSRDLLFTEDDWIGAVAFGDKKASRGVGDRLQQEATAMRTVSRAAENKAKAISERYTRKLAMKMQQEVEDSYKAMDGQIKKLTSSIEADTRKLRTDSGAAERLAAATKEREALEEVAAKTKSDLKELRKIANKAPSWFHGYAATAVLATVAHSLGGPLGAGGTLAVGAALGKGLASKAGQLAVAGQTRPQTAVRNAVEAAQQNMIPQVQEGTLGMLSQSNSAGQTLRAIDRAQRAAAARAGMLTNQ